MAPSPADTTIEGYPAELLVGFLCEFNVLRRYVATYPANHPIIDTGAQKVVSLLDQLLADRDDLTFGFTRNALMLGSGVLDRKNPIFRDLAGYFFNLGVASLTFRPGLTRQGLRQFCEITARKRDAAGTGIEAEVAASGILAIQVRMVRYDAFRASEGPIDDEEPSGCSLWERFIAGLMQDLPGGVEAPPDSGNAGPEQLADYVNRRVTGLAPGQRVQYSKSIAAFIGSVDRQMVGLARDLAVERWKSLVNRLAPEVRREVLRESFRELAERSGEKGSRDGGDGHGDIGASFFRIGVQDLWDETSDAGDIPADVAGDALERQVRLVFREDSADPDLELSARSSRSEQLPPLIRGEVEVLRATLTERQEARQLAAAILALRRLLDDPGNIGLLDRHLNDLCFSFLSQGDFSALAVVFSELARLGGAEASLFHRSDFLDEVLNGLDLWDKDKFAETAVLIDTVGAPFVGPLLNRLAVEENSLLRRFCLERLRSIGAPAREAAILRLRDERWHFVRNLIVLLRSFNDPQVVEDIRPLMDHKHPKVRLEALKTLINFNAPEAERRLLRELESIRSAVRLTAVHLAAMSRSSQVLDRLRALLAQPVLTAGGYALKDAVVDSLARIGNPTVLPDLERLMRSRSFLRPLLMKRLKVRAARSLRQYPVDKVRPELMSLAAGLDRGEERTG